jgi:hypothetical protein
MAGYIENRAKQLLSAYPKRADINFQERAKVRKDGGSAKRLVKPTNKDDSRTARELGRVIDSIGKEHQRLDRARGGKTVCKDAGGSFSMPEPFPVSPPLRTRPVMRPLPPSIGMGPDELEQQFLQRIYGHGGSFVALIQSLPLGSPRSPRVIGA